MTLSSTGTLNFEGNSSLTNGGVLTNNNPTANTISLSTGGLTVTGGTICGTAPSLNTAPLTFSGTPVAGANCTSGNQDQIQVRTGTTALSGNVPTGYTIVANASISTAAAVTNNGEIQLAGGTLLVGSATTLTNNGTFDVTALNATIDASSTNTAGESPPPRAVRSPSKVKTLSSNSSHPALTNDGTMTLSSAGTLNFEGNSSLTNGGVLTNNNTNANSISLSTGGLTVTGGTICGTAPWLNTAPLTFSGTPVAGPDCAAGVAQDVIQARTGTNPLSGTIPTGYSIIADATLTTAASVTNNGSLDLAGGTLIISSAGTFTNDGGFDTTSANGTLDAAATTGGAFVNGSTGNWTIEGNLAVASNSTVPALTNSGFLGIAPGAVLDIDGSNTFIQFLFGDDRLRHRRGQHLERELRAHKREDQPPGRHARPDRRQRVHPGVRHRVLRDGRHQHRDLHHGAAQRDRRLPHSNETGVIGGAPATATTTMLTSTANPAVYGQPLSLTATVTPSSGTPDRLGHLLHRLCRYRHPVRQPLQRHDHRLDRNLVPARRQ